MNAHDVKLISALSGYAPSEVSAAIESLSDGFFVPEVDYFESDPEENGEGGPGYYSRLSAPGYLDCTDWSGPFENVHGAWADLLNAYAN